MVERFSSRLKGIPNEKQYPRQSASHSPIERVVLVSIRFRLVTVSVAALMTASVVTASPTAASHHESWKTKEMWMIVGALVAKEAPAAWNWTKATIKRNVSWVYRWAVDAY
jgi:hypothetical protein